MLFLGFVLCLGSVTHAATSPSEPPAEESKPAPFAPAPEETVQNELRRAKNEYAYGNYDEAIKVLQGLLYPMRVYTGDQEIEARRYLALSHYLLGQPELVRSEFTKLLYVNPDYELDPFTVAPPVIEVFEQIRKDLKPELDVIRSRRMEQKLGAPQPKGVRRTIEQRVVERSDLATLMPYGVGQFRNGDTRAGVVFALSEGLLTIANIGAYLWGWRVGRQRSPNEKLFRALSVTQYSTAVAFGLTWSIGVVHARLRFQPEVFEPPIIRDEPVGNRAVGASLKLDLP